jgi:hypothetical protein
VVRLVQFFTSADAEPRLASVYAEANFPIPTPPAWQRRTREAVNDDHRGDLS